MNQYPIHHSKKALATWALFFLVSLFLLGSLLVRHGQPTPQVLMLNCISIWMLLSHNTFYRHLKRYRLQFLPEVFRLIAFVILGYMLANWFL